MKPTTAAGKRLARMTFDGTGPADDEIVAVEVDAGIDERERIAAALEADWLETGPWRSFGEVDGDPYARVRAIVGLRRRS